MNMKRDWKAMARYAYRREWWDALALILRSAPEGALENETFQGADLRYADLRRANLRDVDLRDSNLRGANLWGAVLCNANLWRTDLRHANLRSANLWRADLLNAHLWGANLQRAELRNSDLWDAHLGNIKMNWKSHELIGERLRQAAGDDGVKRMVAGVVAFSSDWCWDEMRANVPREINGFDALAWAVGEMRTWVTNLDELPSEVADFLGIHDANQGA